PSRHSFPHKNKDIAQSVHRIAPLPHAYIGKRGVWIGNTVIAPSDMRWQVVSTFDSRDCSNPVLAAKRLSRLAGEGGEEAETEGGEHQKNKSELMHASALQAVQPRLYVTSMAQDKHFTPIARGQGLLGLLSGGTDHDKRDASMAGKRFADRNRCRFGLVGSGIRCLQPSVSRQGPAMGTVPHD